MLVATVDVLRQAAPPCHSIVTANDSTSLWLWPTAYASMSKRAMNAQDDVGIFGGDSFISDGYSVAELHHDISAGAEAVSVPGAGRA